jgi:glycosyltransferase involved in cell wall biosynthesis
MEKVTVIIPCRNEINFIREFFYSLKKQDYPSRLLEIIFVDGKSDDGTREYLRSVECDGVLVLDNSMQFVSEALNMAIKNSSGDVILRMDVHCVFSPNYISTLVKYLQENPKAGNVGVPTETLANGPGIVAASIALVLTTRIGMGNSSFRTESPIEAKCVDTVGLGCWRRSIFDIIGFFDTDLVRNQDDEFNQRVLKSGFEVHMLPGPKLIYFGRRTFSSHVKMFYQYGLFKPLVNKKIGKITSLRQLAPVALVVFLFANLILASIVPKVAIISCFVLFLAYFVAAPFFLSNYSGSKKLIYFPYVYCLILTHLAYGIGYLKGMFFGLSKKKIGLSR